ncbi:hypothetical protein HGB25_03220, partial [Candidatus Saccharibacteria bacterium]|nr:hypothetical protein [Candidatus Saccharibacteria bacterium]
MNKIVMYGIGTVSLAAIGFAAVPSLAGAQGAVSRGVHSGGNGSGYTQMIQTKAKLLGVTEEELKTQLQTKTMLQLAEEKGISEEQLHTAMEAAARQRWADKGLTQSEIDARLKNMAERQAGDHDANSANR